MDTLEALRILTSVSLPSRRRDPGAPAKPALSGRAFPWEQLWQPAIAHGLAPLVAYNLEFRLGGGAPQEIHDALLGYHQGTLNDNVYKLVTLKKVLHGADFPAVMLHATAYADAVYPHIAFRPLPELRLLVDRKHFFAFSKAAKEERFVPEGEDAGAMVLSDGRFRILLHDAAWPGGRKDEELWSRGLQAKAMGEKVRRPSIEDAVLTHVALLAAAAFDAPLIEYVDLRELVQGAPSQSGTYGRAPDRQVVLERAREVGLTRALYCAMQVLAHFFPEVGASAAALRPEVNVAVRALLDRAVVEPSATLDRKAAGRMTEEIRKLLTGA
jgi:hypothetical protein